MAIYQAIVDLDYFILGTCMAVFLMISVPIIYSMETLQTQLPQSYFVSATAQPSEYDTADSAKELTIALLTDALFSDAGWGAFGYNAAQALNSKYGHEVDFKDDVPIPDIETTLRDYAAGGYDMIIAQGFEWGDPAIKVGKDYPNTKFVVFTGLANSTNVASIFPRQQEGAYLLGALAAMMSKTGVIGFIGGERYPSLINVYEGYKQGAKAIDNNIEVLDTYLNDWDSPEKGNEAAMSQINKGADLLLHVADTSGHGVIQAAKEKGVYAFGAVSDQNILAPNTVLSSFVLDVVKAFDQADRMVQVGNFTGQIFTPGLEAGKNASGEGIVYIAPFHSLENKVPDDIKAKFEQLEQDVLKGKIVVPEKYPGAIGNLTTIS
ncbi:MAG: BMP family protein [Nitrososphaeraceae archaeon]|jgi:basic membrane protein A